MILLIPHIAFSVILTAVIFSLMDWPATAIFTFAAFFIVFSILWPPLYFFNKSYFRKLPKLMNLILYFLKELVLANFRVAYDVITPTTMMRPAIVALPLDAQTDLEITLLANMISLTPGTLSLELSKDKKYLFVHVIFFSKISPEEIKAGIKNGFEKRLLEVTR